MQVHPWLLLPPLQAEERSPLPHCERSQARKLSVEGDIKPVVEWLLRLGLDETVRAPAFALIPLFFSLGGGRELLPQGCLRIFTVSRSFKLRPALLASFTCSCLSVSACMRAACRGRICLPQQP